MDTSGVPVLGSMERVSIRGEGLQGGDTVDTGRETEADLTEREEGVGIGVAVNDARALPCVPLAESEVRPVAGGDNVREHEVEGVLVESELREPSILVIVGDDESLIDAKLALGVNGD